MTRWFDRPVNGTLIHTQTLCALSIVDYNQIEANDCAQLFQAIDALGLAQDTRDQAFRRLVFNWMAANCDDHTKNHSFLMTESGTGVTLVFRISLDRDSMLSSGVPQHSTDSTVVQVAIKLL